MRLIAAGSMLLALAAAPFSTDQPLSDAQAAKSSGGDCVTFGTPKPTTTYVYERRGAGPANRYTHQWREFTNTLARVAVVRGPVNEVVVNRHTIVDDVTVIDSMTSAASTGNSKTTFTPGVIGDPMFRACAGQSWTIRAVRATYEGGGRNSSANTYPGTLRIVSIRESVTVPAGTFPSVHYTRILSTPGGQSVDEYWKSIEHGVVMKQVSSVAGSTSTAEVQAIK
jgi:hypothetical protein